MIRGSIVGMVAITTATYAAAVLIACDTPKPTPKPTQPTGRDVIEGTPCTHAGDIEKNYVDGITYTCRKDPALGLVWSAK